MSDVTFKHGSPLMVDYTPSAAVAVGDVVVIGDYPRVAHRPIAADALGALAACGGVYTCAKATGTGTAIAAGKRVYWDESEATVTETATDNTIFGVTVAAAGDSDATVDVIHDPQVDSEGSA